MHKTIFGPPLAAILATLAGCSGQVTAASSDAGKGVESAPTQDAGPDTSTGEPPLDSGGGGFVDTGTASSGDAADTCTSPGVQCVTPPPPPSGASSTAGTVTHTYGIHQLYLGDTDRNGLLSADAWAAYGYDLDGRVTVASSTDVCTLAPGAPRDVQADGNGGIDNSFGENIMPILVTLAGEDLDARVNASIQGGGFTDLVYVVGFDDTSGNTTTAKGLSGVLLGGGNYATLHDGGVPAWNIGTSWPIRPESLSGCPAGVCPTGTDPIASALAQFPAAYQKSGTFVGGSPVGVVLLLPLLGPSLSLSLQSTTVTFGPAVPGSVTDGTFAGVLETTQFVSALQAAAGSISTSLCSGSAFQSIAQQIEQASDIVFDSSSGVISNPAGTACNAISIGLGFDGVEIATPQSSDVTGPTPQPPNPCTGQ